MKGGMKNRMAKNMPVGVKILAVLAYIGAVLALLAGIAMFFGSAVFVTYLGAFAGLTVVAGIIMIAFAVLYFFIGRGLWKGQNWARIVAIILSVLGLISALFSIATAVSSSVISLIINIVIIWYLGFKPNVKKAFK